MDAVTQPVILEAIQSGDFELVQKLVTEKPVSASARNNQGVSAILIALYFNQPEIARFLAGQVQKLDIFEAASLGNLDQAKKLISQEPGLVNAVNVDGFQPLGLAAFFGQVEMAEFLIEHDALVNSPSQNALMAAPLHSALATRNIKIAKILLENGADVNLAESGGYTPLHIAAQNGDLEGLDMVLAHHPHLNPRLEADGLTPLGTAVKYGNEEAAKRLRRIGCLE